MIRRDTAATMATMIAVVAALAAPAAPGAVPAAAPAAAASSGTMEPAAASAVTWFPAAQVDDAFGKGSVLYAGPRYMIHASRREAPGQAEVHVKDADIIHVLQGRATFVTDGRVVGGRATAPDEIRGDSIEGGRTMTLSKGDVVIVPEGTPHWFREIDGPFLYYVVKVR